MLLPPADHLQQGDVVRLLFFPVIGQVAFDFLSTPEGGPAKLVRSIYPTNGVPPNPKALFPVIAQPAIIVSQTCDLEHGGFLLAAPLLPMGACIKEYQTNEQVKLQVGRMERYLGFFPIGKQPKFRIEEDLVADFRRISSFEVTAELDRKYLLEARLASLTSDARAIFQHKLSNWFGRYAADDNWMEPRAETT
jgi:hypothetical protein